MRAIACLLALAVAGLAGCVVVEAPEEPGPGRPGTSGIGAADLRAPGPDAPGLLLEGHVAGGRVTTLEVEARNDGPYTYWVPGGCEDPFHARLEGPNGTLLRAGLMPGGGCRAQAQPFRPGEVLRHGRTWDGNETMPMSGIGLDGTQWVSGEMPAGRYAWNVSFFVTFEPGGQEDRPRATLHLTVPFDLPPAPDGGARRAGSDGVQLEGRMAKEGDLWVARVNATKEDGVRRSLVLGCDGDRLQDRVLDDGRAAVDPQPCDWSAPGSWEWPDGEVVQARLTWDGTVVDGDGRRVAAPPGHYQWVVWIQVRDGEAEDDADGQGDLRSVIIGWDIHLGATG